MIVHWFLIFEWILWSAAGIDFPLIPSGCLWSIGVRCIELDGEPDDSGCANGRDSEDDGEESQLSICIHILRFSFVFSAANVSIIRHLLVPEITFKLSLHVLLVKLFVIWIETLAAEDWATANSLWSFESHDIFVTLINKLLDDFLTYLLIGAHSVSIVVLGQIIKSWISRLSECGIHTWVFSSIGVCKLDLSVVGIRRTLHHILVLVTAVHWVSNDHDEPGSIWEHKKCWWYPNLFIIYFSGQTNNLLFDLFNIGKDALFPKSFVALHWLWCLLLFLRMCSRNDCTNRHQ